MLGTLVSSNSSLENAFRQEGSIIMEITSFVSLLLREESQSCTGCCLISEKSCFINAIQFSNWLPGAGGAVTTRGQIWFQVLYRGWEWHPSTSTPPPPTWAGRAFSLAGASEGAVLWNTLFEVFKSPLPLVPETSWGHQHYLVGVSQVQAGTQLGPSPHFFPLGCSWTLTSHMGWPEVLRSSAVDVWLDECIASCFFHKIMWGGAARKVLTCWIWTALPQACQISSIFWSITVLLPLTIGLYPCMWARAPALVFMFQLVQDSKGGVSRTLRAPIMGTQGNLLTPSTGSDHVSGTLPLVFESFWDHCSAVPVGAFISIFRRWKCGSHISIPIFLRSGAAWFLPPQPWFSPWGPPGDF